MKLLSYDQQQSIPVCHNLIQNKTEAIPVLSSFALFQIPEFHLSNIDCPDILKRFKHNPLPGSVSNFEGEITTLKSSRYGVIAAYLLKPLGIFLPLNIKPIGLKKAVSYKIRCEVSVSTNIQKNSVIKKRKYIYISADNTVSKEINLNSEIYLDKKGILWESIGICFAMKINCETEPGTKSEIAFKSNRYYLNLKILKLPIPRFMSLGQIVVRHKSVSAQNFNLSISLHHPILGTLFEQTSVFKEKIYENRALTSLHISVQ